MAGIVLIQAVYFYYILSSNSSLEKADLIVVFPGESERIEAGYQLARSEYAPNFLIAGTTEKNVESNRKNNRLPSSVRQVFAGTTRSTFEDALCTKNIVDRYRFRSIILVTSSYHLPRAYFLLRIFLTGSQVKVQTYKVAHVYDNSLDHRNLRKICNEMLKFWTGIAEMTSYKITGSLLSEKLGSWPMIKSLKKRVFG